MKDKKYLKKIVMDEVLAYLNNPCPEWPVVIEGKLIYRHQLITMSKEERNKLIGKPFHVVHFN